MVKYNHSPEAADEDRLNAVFAALADPTRRAIIARLAEGPSSVGELAQPFDMSWPAVTKHLKVLERSGLIAREKDGRVHRCRFEPGPLEGARDWMEQTRAFWEERFDQLARYLESQSMEQTQTNPQTIGGGEDNGPSGDK